MTPQSPSKQAPWDLTQFSQSPSAALSCFPESHRWPEISSLSKVILVLEKPEVARHQIWAVMGLPVQNVIVSQYTHSFNSVYVPSDQYSEVVIVHTRASPSTLLGCQVTLMLHKPEWLDFFWTGLHIYCFCNYALFFPGSINMPGLKQLFGNYQLNV